MPINKPGLREWKPGLFFRYASFSERKNLTIVKNRAYLTWHQKNMIFVY